MQLFRDFFYAKNNLTFIKLKKLRMSGKFPNFAPSN